MRYHPDDEQLALASAFEDFLVDLLPVARLHASPGETPEIWEQLEGLGLFGIAVSEELGGVGLGAAEEALIVTALGRRLTAPSVLATIAASHADLEGGPAAEGKVRRVGYAYRNGGRLAVVADGEVDLLLVRDGDRASLHTAPAGEARPLEDRLWQVRLCEIDQVGNPLAEFGPAALRRLRLIDAAYLAGLSEAARDMAVAYANMREQFGRPIGSFQAVKHHCSNMAIASRCAVDLASFASIAVDDDRDDAELQVECALLVAANAALDNAGKNIQIHGGIGFSDEADPHLILKRARLMIEIAGGIEAANLRIGAIPPRV